MLGKCLVDDCDRVSCSRGLCIRCLLNTQKAISKGLYTWSYLEEIEMSIKPGEQPQTFTIPIDKLKRDKYHTLLYERRNEGKDYKEYIRI